MVHPNTVPPDEKCAVTGLDFPDTYTAFYEEGNLDVWQIIVPVFFVNGDESDNVFEIDDIDYSVLSERDLISVYFYSWAYWPDDKDDMEKLVNEIDQARLSAIHFKTRSAKVDVNIIN